MGQIEVGILGATGMVGQQFIALLANHPWFKVTWLGASHRSEGKAYQDAAAWRLPAPLPDDIARLTVNAATPGGAPKLVFSGLDSSVAGEIEGAFAQAGHFIISNSKNYRMEPDVPLLIPEVNAGTSGPARGAGGVARLEGPHRDEPELFDYRALDGARAAPSVRLEERHDHDAPGHLRRRLSRSGVVGHTRQRDSVHRRRRA